MLQENMAFTQPCQQKKALELCNDLVVLPVDIEKYRKVSKDIFKIFKCYSKKIEPVSIDEAYLDVTTSNYCEVIQRKWPRKYVNAFIKILV